MTSSKPDYLPKAFLQIPSHWGLWLQHRNLGVGDTNVQPTELCLIKGARACSQADLGVKPSVAA